MDAFQHIKKGMKHPIVFLTSGMQEVTVSEKPILLSVDFEGSYEFDAPENKQEKELTAVLVFASRKEQHADNQLNS
jgi:hypothetical protein